jgi:hypothetical protein
MTVAAASLIGLLLFGLMTWAFYQSIQALTVEHFPSDLTLYMF